MPGTQAPGTAAEETLKNIKPPEMITDANQYPLYEKRLERWSRLCTLSNQTQFDLVLSSIPLSNPLCEKLEEEVGNSSERNIEEHGIQIILNKLKEWFGKEEDIEAFVNYKEFENKKRLPSQNLIEFLNEWESLYNKCKARNDTVSDRVLAFKLMVACNMTEMDHKLVFREAKSKEKDNKVFERTKAAIRMFYDAGHLKPWKILKPLCWRTHVKTWKIQASEKHCYQKDGNPLLASNHTEPGLSANFVDARVNQPINDANALVVNINLQIVLRNHQKLPKIRR